MQVRRVLTRESTKAKRACCASLTLLISRARRSRLDGNSLLRGFHLAFASGQFSLNRRANERARIREASRLRRALNASDQRFVQSDSAASCLGFYRFHTLYGVTIRARDRAVHECARTAPNRARAKLNESKWLTGKQAQPRNNPLCSTTGLCGWYCVVCGSASMKKRVNN